MFISIDVRSVFFSRCMKKQHTNTYQISIMVVCTDLTSQNRTASGIQLKHKEKVIVGARTQQINCRNQYGKLAHR